MSFIIEVEVTDIFGPGNPVLMSDVECTGSEKELYLCESASIGTHTCQKYEKSAGVICSKYFGELKCWNRKEFWSYQSLCIH